MKLIKKFFSILEFPLCKEKAHQIVRINLKWACQDYCIILYDIKDGECTKVYKVCLKVDLLE